MKAINSYNQTVMSQVTKEDKEIVKLANHYQVSESQILRNTLLSYQQMFLIQAVEVEKNIPVYNENIFNFEHIKNKPNLA